jgi:hypothetical protein
VKDSEDNLENFFRSRAEGNQYEFEEGDWAKIETKLDSDMPVLSPFQYSKYGWMGLGSLITAAFFVSYILFMAEPKSPKQSISNQEISEIDKSTLPTTNSSESSKKPVLTKNIENRNNSEKIVSVPNKTNAQSDLIRNSEQPVAEDKTETITVNNDALPLAKKDNKISLKVIESKPMFIGSNSSPVEVNNNRAAIIGAEQKKALYQFDDYKLVHPEITGNDDALIPTSRKRFYTLSLLGGIDITSTPQSAWGTPTFTFGASGEYFIGNRWSIGIGANLSTKKYQAKGREYSPPKGFWTNGIVPDSTNAECQVLDVPITASYFQPINDKSNIIISGGVSSWFVLTEEYWYKYKSNNPDLVSWWGGKNENQYWLSIINLSIAYEYNLNKNIGVAFGPYINIPLSGVGHGNVELQSFGFKGALRFNKFKLSKF